jgi:hypothetical protein
MSTASFVYIRGKATMTSSFLRHFAGYSKRTILLTTSAMNFQKIPSVYLFRDYDPAVMYNIDKRMSQYRWFAKLTWGEMAYGVRNPKIVDPVKVQKELEDIEQILAPAEREPHGERRGRTAIRGFLIEQHKRRQALQRGSKNKDTTVTIAEDKITAAKIEDRLFFLIEKRHALRNGFENFSDMSQLALAQSFLGDGTNQLMPQRHARHILRESWQTGKSRLLDKFEQDDRKERLRNKKGESNAVDLSGRRRKRHKDNHGRHRFDQDLYEYMLQKFKLEDQLKAKMIQEAKEIRRQKRLLRQRLTPEDAEQEIKRRGLGT